MCPSKIVRMIRMWIEACLLELNMNFAKVWPKDFSSEWRFRMKTINSIPYLNLSKVHTWPSWMTLDTSPSHSQMSQVCSGLPTLWELVDIVWLESTMDPEKGFPTGPLPKSSPGIVSWPDAWQYLGKGSYRIGPTSWGIERIGSKSEDMRQQLQELDNYIQLWEFLAAVDDGDPHSPSCAQVLRWWRCRITSEPKPRFVNQSKLHSFLVAGLVGGGLVDGMFKWWIGMQ